MRIRYGLLILFLMFLRPAWAGWTDLAPLATARSNHTATLLPNGKILVAGGIIAGSTTATAELFDPTTGEWKATGSMASARAEHTATLLHDGRVLVVAGSLGVNQLASAEMYYPDSGQWLSAGSIPDSRQNHTATLLADGRVLVAGGYAGSLSRASKADVQIFDPNTLAWSSANSMPQARDSHTATLMATGQILMAGGYAQSVVNKSPQSLLLNNATLYDPATGQWSTTPSMPQARALHTATLLHDGSVLLAGGEAATTTGAIFTPGPNTWAATTGGLAQSRRQHSSTLLPDGRVLFVGGHDGAGNYRNTAEIYNYDPAPGTWSSAGTVATRAAHSATLLSNGMVVIAGGYNGAAFSSSAQRYEYAQGTWSNASFIPATGFYPSATLLGNGKVLVAGGIVPNNPPLASASIYDAETNNWTTVGALNTPRGEHSATLLPNGKVLVAGGYSTGSGLNSVELFDPGSGQWIPTSSLAEGRGRHRATLLANGKVLISGGEQRSSAEMFDPSNGTWSTAGNMGTVRYSHTATLLPDGRVLVAGGSNGTSQLNSALLFDPVGNTWTPTGSMNTARIFHAAALLPNGKVLVAGGQTAGQAGVLIKAAELYDPATGTWADTGSLSYGRGDIRMTLLPNGKVLLTGSGQTGEVYDPLTGTWSVTSNMAVSYLYGHAAALLPNGKVMTVGGGLGNAVELYDMGLNYPPVSRRPYVDKVTNPLFSTGAMSIGGFSYSLTAYTGPSSGNGSDSGSNQPIVQLQRLDNEQIFYARPAALGNSTYVSEPFDDLPLGHYRLTAFVNASPSFSRMFAVIPATAPPAPEIIKAVSGNGSITLYLEPITADGGIPISHRAVCVPAGGGNGIESTSSTSPIKVTGLINGQNYACSVTSSNTIGEATSPVFFRRAGVSIAPILNLLLD